MDIVEGSFEADHTEDEEYEVTSYPDICSHLELVSIEKNKSGDYTLSSIENQITLFDSLLEGINRHHNRNVAKYEKALLLAICSVKVLNNEDFDLSGVELYQRALAIFLNLDNYNQNRFISYIFNTCKH